MGKKDNNFSGTNKYLIIPPQHLFFNKTSEEIEALTLDSLASINSPYIDGTFAGANGAQ